MTDWPRFDVDEIQAVQAVLESGRVNYWNGQEGRAFEREFAEYHGAAYGIALANGSLALELALHALGVGPGDDVVVTPRTFLASASSIVMCGARPVFADVDAESGNITLETVRSAMTPNTRAIMAVHLAGWPCDMVGLRALADEHDLFLIEDCAQAHGAAWNGRSVGGWGHAAAFSFCTDKIISTGGEGGMLLLHDEVAWRRAWSYKDHGKDWDAVYNTEHPPGFRWLHHSFGTNWRLTEMQSAIGRIQLRKLDGWLERRNRNAAMLAEALAPFRVVRVPVPPVHVRHAYYKFYAYVVSENLNAGWSRDMILKELNARSVPAMQGSCPEVYLEKAFEGTEWRPTERHPVAKELGETSLMFPVHPTLSDLDLDHMRTAIGEVLRRASR